jgi:uncharacterized protein (TIGR00255 family)
MTGFGRASGETPLASWSVEARSVNGRTLDVRANLPPGFDALDAPIRSGAKTRFERGNLTVSVRVEARIAPEALQVDEAALSTLKTVLERQSGHLAGELAIATLMGLRGVVTSGQGPDARALIADPELLAALETGIAQALDALHHARQAEGAALAALLSGQLDAMKARRTDAAAEAARQPFDLRERLMTRLADLGGLERLDAGRLEAEAALLASRADVREELDRLDAHIASGHALLITPGSIGRKLDFLSQELMREANTLCAKAASLPLTQAGLALKVLIDAFKEQAANVE